MCPRPHRWAPLRLEEHVVRPDGQAPDNPLRLERLQRFAQRGGAPPASGRCHCLSAHGGGARRRVAALASGSSLERCYSVTPTTVTVESGSARRHLTSVWHNTLRTSKRPLREGEIRDTLRPFTA